MLTFPGQGSQRPGMGAPWAETPSWAVVERASAVAGRDLATLLLEADAEELRSTRNAQLATLVTSLVALDALRTDGLAAP
ncbi:MAG: ACP S-malonyltransferase, partial [Acidimicrobiia bacterium]|nr:ACP S-malonyltransferase [Acidimicrobiia bacterium]